MFGMLGTILVIWQMSALANGAPHWALLMGCGAACAWMAHGYQRKDNWILITNIILLGIAIYGLTIGAQPAAGRAGGASTISI